MDRSNYPTKVEVRSGDLARTESTKAFHLLARAVDFGQPGVVRGLQLQVSATGVQLFDALAGYGYAANGEYVELTTTLEAQSPGGQTETPYLVGLMYREVAQKAGAAESDGVARERETVRSAELLSFDETTWDALPSSYDADLAINAKDRFLVLGVVTIPADTANPVEIVSPPTFDLIKTASGLANISGLFLTALDPTTNDSQSVFGASTDSARLVYQPSTTLLAYRAPGDDTDLSQASPFNVAGLGTPVDVSAGGSFTLTSANGLNTVSVEVAPAHLPTVTSTSVTDLLVVSTLYSPRAPRNSARDDLHRSQLGSQVPSATNPHGSRLSDIQALVENILGTLRLGTSLNTTALAEIAQLVSPGVAALDSATDRRAQLIWETEGFASARLAGGLPLKLRLYHANTDGFWLTANALFRNDGVDGAFERAAANGDNPSVGSWLWELNPETGRFRVAFHPSTSSDAWAYSSWARTEVEDNFATRSRSVNGSLSLGGNLLGSDTDLEIARLYRNYLITGDDRVLLDESRDNLISGASRSRRYRRENADGLDGHRRIDERVINASWSNASAQWTQDDNTRASLREIFSADGYSLHTVPAGTGTFAEAAWNRISFVPSVGDYAINRVLRPYAAHATNWTLGTEAIPWSVLNAYSGKFFASGPGSPTSTSRGKVFRDTVLCGRANVLVNRDAGGLPTINRSSGYGLNVATLIGGAAYMGFDGTAGTNLCNALQLTWDAALGFDPGEASVSFSFGYPNGVASSGGTANSFRLNYLVIGWDPLIVRFFEFSDNDPSTAAGGGSFIRSAAIIPQVEVSVHIFGNPKA